MEQVRDGEKSSPSASPTQTERTPMEKPQVHTTESGTQYVKAVDVVRSKAGWAEIQRLKEANLVRSPSSTNGGNSSSQQSDNE